MKLCSFYEKHCFIKIAILITKVLTMPRTNFKPRNLNFVCNGISLKFSMKVNLFHKVHFIQIDKGILVGNSTIIEEI